MKLSEIKINPDNPRIIKDDKFKKLVKSIKEFPKMMELRPMVINNDNIVLGGNMRLKALKELGYKEIPDTWVKYSKDLTEEEQRRFIIADNVGFGEHDWEMLSNEWNIKELADWGIDLPVTLDELDKLDINDVEFEEEFNKTDNTNCQLPIVPDFFETHECFIIPVHNEIDENFIRDLFNLNENYTSTSGDNKVRKTNVISLEKLREWALK